MYWYYVALLFICVRVNTGVHIYPEIEMETVLIFTPALEIPYL